MQGEVLQNHGAATLLWIYFRTPPRGKRGRTDSIATAQ